MPGYVAGAAIFLGILAALCFYAGMITFPLQVTDITKPDLDLQHLKHGFYQIPADSYSTISSLGTSTTTDSTELFTHIYEYFLVSVSGSDTEITLSVRVEGKYRKALQTGEAPELIGRLSIPQENALQEWEHYPMITVTHPAAILAIKGFVFLLAGFLLILLLIYILHRNIR